MVIEDKDFRLTPIDDSSDRYDLELIHHIGGKNPRDEFKIEAYGVTLESGLKRIANYRTRENLSGTVTIKEYLDEFRRISKELAESCK